MSILRQAPKRLALLTVITFATLAAKPACADGLSADQVRALVEGGKIVALEEILARNEKGLGGRIIEVDIEKDDGTYVYEFKVLRPNGRYREVKIDARTGALLQDD